MKRSYHYRPYYKMYAYTTTYCLCYFILLLLSSTNNNDKIGVGVAIINAKPASADDYNQTTDYVDFGEQIEKDEDTNTTTTNTTTEEEDVDFEEVEEDEEEKVNPYLIYKDIIDDPFNLPVEPTLFEYDLNGKGGQWNFILEYPISSEVVKDVQEKTDAAKTSIEIRLYDRGCLYNNGNDPVELIVGTTVNDPTFSPFDYAATSIVISNEDNNDDDFDYDYIDENSDKISIARLDMLLGGKIDDMTIRLLIEEYPTLRTIDGSDNNIEFCVRISLLKDKKFEINTIETIIVLEDIFVINDSTVVLLDAYTKRKENQQNSGRLSYGVDAYICNGKNLPIIADQTGLAAGLMYEVCHSINSVAAAETIKPMITERISFPQGAILRICVKPDKYSTGLVSVTNVQTLLFEAVLYKEPVDDEMTDTEIEMENEDDDFVAFAYRQKSVENGYSSLLRLSEMKCEPNPYYEGEIVCAVDTLLRSEFYIPRRRINKETSTSQLVSSMSLSSPKNISYSFLPLMVKVTGRANLQFGDGKNTNTDDNSSNEDRQRQRNLLLRRTEHGQQQQQQQQLQQYDTQQQQDQDQQFLLQRMLQRNTTMTSTISTGNGPQQRQLQVGQQNPFWEISIPKVVFDDIDGGSRLDFQLLYSLSDAISSDMIQIEIWTEGCQRIGLDDDSLDDDGDGNSTSTKTSGPLLTFSPSSLLSSASGPTSDLIEILTTDAIATGDGKSGKTQRFRTTIRWKYLENKQFGVQLVDSDFFKEISDGFAQIALCVRTQLHTPPPVPDVTDANDSSSNSTNTNDEVFSIGQEVNYR